MEEFKISSRTVEFWDIAQYSQAQISREGYTFRNLSPWSLGCYWRIYHTGRLCRQFVRLFCWPTDLEHPHARRPVIIRAAEQLAASTRSVSDGSHSLNAAKYGHKAALFLSPALFHESLTSVGWRIAAHPSQSVGV